jgi:hypothetical protein
VTFVSESAGTVTGHASVTVVAGGLTLHRETDGSGNNSGDAVTSYVEVTAPPALQDPDCTSWDINPYSGQAPLDVIGNGVFSDPDNLVSSTYVEWGDGSANSNTGLDPTSVAHTFEARGTFISQLVLVKQDNAEIRTEACRAQIEVEELAPAVDQIHTYLPIVIKRP